MAFNWAAPTKSSRVDTFMMVKTEASRIKRLASIKSTISNQNSADVQRHRKRSSVEGNRPSSRLHHRELEEDSRVHSSSNNQSMFTEFLPATSKQSVFDDIQMHAAADGLFHPDSSIGAFAEHDAKQCSLDSMSSRCSSRKVVDSSPDPTSSRMILPSTMSSSTPSLLPPLSRQSIRDRLSSRSDSSLPRAGTARPHSASNPDLLAPRRSGAIPSSADRNALDLYDDDWDDGGSDIADPDEQPESGDQVTTKQSTAKVSDLLHPDENNNEVAMHRKAMEKAAPKVENHRKTKHTSGGLEMQCDKDMSATAAAKATHKTVKRSSKSTKTSMTETNCVFAETGVQRRVDAASKLNDIEAPTDQKPKGKPRSAPLKKGSKSQSGVSLADLREEHRLALEMLSELGGPHGRHFKVDNGDEARGKSTHTGQKTHSDVASTPTGSLVNKLRTSVPSARATHQDQLSSRSNSAVTSDSMDTHASPNLSGPELAKAALDAARQVLEVSTLSKSPRLNGDKDNEDARTPSEQEIEINPEDELDTEVGKSNEISEQQDYQDDEFE